MAQPTAYERQNDFTDDESSNLGGRAEQSSASLDAEFDAIKTTIDEVLANIAVLQRDDTQVNALVVEHSSLTAACLSAIGALTGTHVWIDRGAWVTTTDYTVNDIATEAGETYLCQEAHTAGTFSTDLAANKWRKIVDKGADGADGVSFNWRGAWAGSTAYAIDDVTEESGSSYICTTGHTSDATTFANDSANWDQMTSAGADGTGSLPTQSGSTTDKVVVSTGTEGAEVWAYVTATNAPTLAPKASPALTGTATAVNLTLSGKLTIDSFKSVVDTVTTVLDFDGALVQKLTLTGAVTFTTSNRTAGCAIDFLIIGDTADRVLTFPVGWTWLTTKTTTIPANKEAMLSLRCFGTADTDIRAMMTVEA